MNFLERALKGMGLRRDTQKPDPGGKTPAGRAAVFSLLARYESLGKDSGIGPVSETSEEKYLFIEGEDGRIYYETTKGTVPQVGTEVKRQRDQRNRLRITAEKEDDRKELLLIRKRDGVKNDSICSTIRRVPAPLSCVKSITRCFQQINLLIFCFTQPFDLHIRLMSSGKHKVAGRLPLASFKGTRMPAFCICRRIKEDVALVGIPERTKKSVVLNIGLLKTVSKALIAYWE